MFYVLYPILIACYIMLIMNKKILIFSILVVVIITGYFYIKTFSYKSLQTEIPINTVGYTCDNNKTIGAEFYDNEKAQSVTPGQPPIPTGYVKLTLDTGAKMTLNQTISADGGRYANPDESFVFWDKGNTAMVLENNKEVNYTNCVVVSKNPTGQNLPQAYTSSMYNFSIHLPTGYTPDESYVYQMTPTKTFSGVKFTIPKSLSTGTNLGSDTYLSVEKIPASPTCTAGMFLDDQNVVEKAVAENGIDYSVGSGTGAGAGNRYEETIYAFPVASNCMAVRYFVHYSVFENYPAGTITEFDQQSLTDQFDAIRQSLVVNS